MEGTKFIYSCKGKIVEQVRGFRYLGTDIHDSVRLEEETGHIMREGERIEGVLRVVWRNKKKSVEA